MRVAAGGGGGSGRRRRREAEAAGGEDIFQRPARSRRRPFGVLLLLKEPKTLNRKKMALVS